METKSIYIDTPNSTSVDVDRQSFDRALFFASDPLLLSSGPRFILNLASVVRYVCGYD